MWMLPKGTEMLFTIEYFQQYQVPDVFCSTYTVNVDKRTLICTYVFANVSFLLFFWSLGLFPSDKLKLTSFLYGPGALLKHNSSLITTYFRPCGVHQANRSWGYRETQFWFAFNSDSSAVLFHFISQIQLQPASQPPVHYALLHALCYMF